MAQRHRERRQQRKPLRHRPAGRPIPSALVAHRPSGVSPQAAAVEPWKALGNWLQTVRYGHRAVNDQITPLTYRIALPV